MFWDCFKTDLTRAAAILINHEHERFAKAVVIRILRDYAKTTDNLVDDDLVDLLEEALKPVSARRGQVGFADGAKHHGGGLTPLHYTDTSHLV